MNTTSPDPNGYSPKDIISRLHRYIYSGVYGIDYTIIPRFNNEDFFERYLITEEDRICILKNLEIENYRGWDYSDHPNFPNDIVYFFSYPISLIPRGIEHASKEYLELYIKITWPQSQNSFMLIISFHD